MILKIYHSSSVMRVKAQTQECFQLKNDFKAKCLYDRHIFLPKIHPIKHSLYGLLEVSYVGFTVLIASLTATFHL